MNGAGHVISYRCGLDGGATGDAGYEASPLRDLFGEDAITAALPRPPHLVVDALARLRLAASGSEDQQAKTGPVHTLPRPWVPGSCPGRLRRAVWSWLDQVAAWYNREYAWRPEFAIPDCWPAHPHLGHELAVLAFLRLEAEAATSPGPLEEWHRQARPMFATRMREQLGQQGCTKDHIAWPAASTWHGYTARGSDEQRKARFELDRAGRTAGERERDDAYDAAVPPWIDPVTGLVDEKGYANALAATAGDGQADGPTS